MTGAAGCLVIPHHEPGCPTLYRFRLLDILAGVRVPCGRGVFDDGSDQASITLGLDFPGTSGYIPSEEAECIVGLLGFVVNVLIPGQVVGDCDTKVFARGNCCEVMAMNGVVGSDGSAFPCFPENLTLEWIEGHLSILLPLLQTVKVILQCYGILLCADFPI